MFKSPLIRTLQLLTQEEIEDLHLFVASPIFNEVHRYHDKVKLFEYIKKYFPTFDHANLQREAAGKALYPGRANPVLELERAMSLLLPIVRQYITVLYFEVRNNRVQAPTNDETNDQPQRLVNFIRQQLSLMRFFSDRLHQIPVSAEQGANRNQNLFQNLTDKLATVFEKQTDFSQFTEHSFCDYYYLHFLAEYEKSHFLSFQQSRQAGDVHILNTVEQLDEFYLLTKLNLMSRLVIRQKTVNFFQDDPVRQARMQANLALTKQVVERLLAEFKNLRSPGVTVYCALFEFLSQEEPGEEADRLAERFSRLLGRHAHRHSIPASRLMDFNILLRNYWVSRWHNTQNLSFLDKNHWLHREQLRLLPAGEGLPSSQFQTIIFTAIKLGKIDWAQEILSNFDPKRIRGEANEDILFNILWAAIHFADAERSKTPEAQRDKLTQSLHKMPHYLNYGAIQDGYLYSIAAMLDVKIRYSLEILDEDEGASMLHTTQTRIKRFKALPEEARERFLNFFSMAIKLSRLKEKKRLTKSDIRQQQAVFHTHLLETPAIAEREWLLAKCEELSKTENK